MSADVAGGTEIVVTPDAAESDELSPLYVMPEADSLSTSRKVESSGQAPPDGFVARAPKVRKSGDDESPWNATPVAFASGRYGSITVSVSKTMYCPDWSALPRGVIS